MAEMERDAVVRILKTLLVNTEASARGALASREWLEGRASGIKTALELLTEDAAAYLADCDSD